MSADSNLNVFLSIGRTSTRAQEDFVRALDDFLHEHGMTSVTIGRSQFTIGKPIDQVVQNIRDCNGAIILAFERTHEEKGTERVALTDGNEQPPASIDGRRVTTPWNHIEAAMALMLGKPMLVLCETGVYQDGMLDRGCGYMVQTIDLKQSVFGEKQFRNIFAAWAEQVRVGGRRRLPGPAGSWTISETVGALTWGQLTGIASTLVAAIAATVKATLLVAPLVMHAPPPSPCYSVTGSGNTPSSVTTTSNANTVTTAIHKPGSVPSFDEPICLRFDLFQRIVFCNFSSFSECDTYRNGLAGGGHHSCFVRPAKVYCGAGTTPGGFDKDCYETLEKCRQRTTACTEVTLDPKEGALNSDNRTRIGFSCDSTHACAAGSICADNGFDGKFYCKALCARESDCSGYAGQSCKSYFDAKGDKTPAGRVCDQGDATWKP